MVQQHINDLSQLGGKDGMREAYLTRVKVFLHMSEANNSVPIHLKVTLSIKEANKRTGIGINSIEDRLREPNCPFVLFVGAKKMIKRKEFKEYISKTFIF